MPESEAENFVARSEALAPKLRALEPSFEARDFVIEYLGVIVDSALTADAAVVTQKVSEVATQMQPNVVCVDWYTAFDQPLNGVYTAATLRLVLSLLWTIGGPRAVSAFMASRPSLETCYSIVSSLSDMPPMELSDHFHFPVVLEQLHPPHAMNYEPVAALLIHTLPSHQELAEDPFVSAVALAYAPKLQELEPETMHILQKCMAVMVTHRIPQVDAVLNIIARSKALAWPLVENFADRDLLAQSVTTPLLGAWFKAGAYDFVIDMIVRADTVSTSSPGTPSHSCVDFMADQFGRSPDAFAALVDYMKANHDSGPQKSLRFVAVVARLTQSAELPADRSDGTEQVQTLQLQLLHDHPRLINYGQGHDAAILANCELPAFTSDIEAEMKLCFQKMYEQQHEIQEVMVMLERLKHSDLPRDQDLFACMIHSLFDEYRFFAQYPVKALATTAVLFGSLVHFRLIGGIPLAIALKFVLDALRQPADSNMFRFGLQALVELRQRLTEFPKYCKILLGIPSLASQHQFYNQIKAIVNPENDDVVAFFRSVNPQFDEDSGNEGDEASRRRVAFIVNNLTAKTLDAKAAELASELHHIGAASFAKTVIARALNEPNYHELYAQLLDLLPREVSELCVDVAVTRIAHLLNSQDVLSVDKRTQLKNLGSFMGILTVARNKAVLFHHVQFRLLLAEGVRYEKLPAVLPFVAKFVSHSANSLVFGPSSPWIRGILAVITELYHFGSLKLTLKFEIEVLGKALETPIVDIEPASYIRDEVLQQEDVAAIAATLGGPATPVPLTMSAPPQHPPQQPRLVPPNVTMGVPMPMPVPPPGSVAGGMQSGASGSVSALPGMPGTVPPGSGPTSAPVPPVPGVPLVGTTEFVTHPGLRQLLDLARSKTLQDVLLPLIDRSVSIASFTAKELVAKDFARESDESKLQTAAHAQASVLAASMALVTAKEPFVEALAHNLRALLAAQGYGDVQLWQEQINLAARETVESLVPLVESVAREKAMVDVDDALMPLYVARQQARLQGQPYQSHEDTKLRVELPELLSVRRDGLLPEQMAVYDQFALQSYSAVDSIGSYSASGTSVQAELQQLTDELKRLESLTRGSQKRLGDHDKDDEVLTLMTQLLTTARNGARRSEEVPLRASQLVVQALFGPVATKSMLYRESLCYLLGQLCRMSGITAKEVVLWLLYADDPKKYNAPVIGTLLRSRLVTPAEIDASLTKDIGDAAAKPGAVDFAARLLLDALIGPEPYCLRSDFAGTIVALSQLDTNTYGSARILLKALADTRGQGSGNEGHVFAEWTRLMQHHATANSQKLLHVFVRDLHRLGWCSEKEQLTQLIRTAVTVSVKSFNQSKSFVGIDAVAMLISTLLSTTDYNESLARMLLTVIVLLVAEDHESENFDTVPHFRLLSSIACSLPRSYVHIFAEILLVLQPISLPGFAASWMTLASHRFVMGRLLENKEHWNQLFALLSAELTFLRQIWLSPVAERTVRGFTYRGVERICLVILHDAPEFFIQYGNEATALLLSEFVQLRNLILCAFPATTVLPDPLAHAEIVYENEDVDLLAATDSARSLLADQGVIKLVESACMPRSTLNPQMVLAVQNALLYERPQSDRGIDFETIQASTLHFNSLATYIAHLYAQNSQSSIKFEDCGAVQLCARMILTSTKENRYALVSAMANQLRYPQAHTEFYSKLLLALFTPFGERIFKDAVMDVRQIVTRVLLERFMAHRPHPWGLVLTFTQLVRSEQYKLGEMPFIKTAETEGFFATLYAHIQRVEVG